MTDAIACERYREQISAMLDDELSAEEQINLQKHIESCASCREYLEMMRYLIDSTKEALVEAPASLCDSVMGEIRAQGNITPIRKTNKVLNFLAGRSFTVIAAAVAAIVILSPTVMDHLGGMKASGSAASEAELYAQTAAAAAYEIRVAPAAGSAVTTAAAAVVSTTAAPTAMAAPTSTEDSIGAPEGGAAAVELSYLHPHNDLHILPDFSACGSSYSSVVLLDSNYLTIDSEIPYWLAEQLPELTEKGFFSYAFLSEEQVKDVLTVTSDGQLPHYILPLHVLDDVNLYPALDPLSDQILFVLMKLSE